MAYAVLPPSFGGKVSVGVLGPGGRLGAWKGLALLGRGPWYSTWSPDGTQIAYVTREPLSLTTVVRVHNIATGSDRELYRGGLIMLCLWASQHPNLFCAEIEGKNTNVLSIAVDSGNAKKIGTLEGTRIFHGVSLDDRMLNTVKVEDRTGYQWEIGTDRDTKGAGGLSSRDGRWNFQSARDAENRLEVQIRPVSGEQDWKHLVYLHGSRAPAFTTVPMRFTADGNWFVFRDRDTDGNYGLYRVSTSGGEPERLGDYPPSEVVSFLSIGPDGRRFIVESPPNRASGQPEFWLLDNFLPASAPAAKPAAKAATK